MKCKHCGHDPNAPNDVIRSVVVDRPGRPVAAPCAISGCHYPHAAEAKLLADFRRLSPTWRDQVLRDVELMARLERDDAAPSARQDAPAPPASPKPRRPRRRRPAGA